MDTKDSSVVGYLKKRTYKQYNEDGTQIKVNAQDIINNTDYNEQTVHANLRRLMKRSDVFHETFRVTRTKDGGKRFTFKQTWYWVGDKNGN